MNIIDLNIRYSYLIADDILIGQVEEFDFDNYNFNCPESTPVIKNIRVYIFDPLYKTVFGSMMLINPIYNFTGTIIKASRFEDFIIFKEYRHRGYGERLVRFIVNKFNIREIYVMPDNIPGIKLYEKCGFVKTSDSDITGLVLMKIT